MIIQVGDKIIQGKVIEKEKARERYEDAVASGKTAVIAEEDSKEKDMISIKVGNLLPGQ